MRFRRAADYLGLERNVVVVSAVAFLLGFGEELWKRYLPKYLGALGAGVGIVGLFGTTKDFFDAIYQYPGGWLADRVGRRRAFLTFIALASAGYLAYLLSPSWPYVFVGLALSMSWAGVASPAIFVFIIGGLREIGEPSRKAMIVDFAEPHLRARTVGLYYLVRSLTITPAAAIGGLLWKVEPQAPFITAGIIGIIGTIVFAATVEERYAG
jgi:MFS family permease